MVGVEGKKERTAQPSLAENQCRHVCCPSLLSLPNFILFPSYPYLGLPSNAAISSSSLAGTMAAAREKGWRKKRGGDRARAAAEAEHSGSGDESGSLLGAVLGLSTLLALAEKVARWSREADMVVAGESEGWKGSGSGEPAQSLRKFDAELERREAKSAFRSHFLRSRRTVSIDEAKRKQR